MVLRRLWAGIAFDLVGSLMLDGVMVVFVRGESVMVIWFVRVFINILQKEALFSIDVESI